MPVGVDHYQLDALDAIAHELTKPLMPVGVDHPAAIITETVLQP
ncbi:hypothetical protein [Nostoc sp. MS1]